MLHTADFRVAAAPVVRWGWGCVCTCPHGWAPCFLPKPSWGLSPLLSPDGRGPDPEALTTAIRQKRGEGAEMRWGDKGSSCDAAGFISNKVTRYLIPFTWSLVSSVWSVRGPQAPVPTN